MIRQFGLAALAALTLAACQPPAPKGVDATASVQSIAPDVAAAAAPSTAPAVSTEPAYVGLWAENASSCTLAKDDPDAPTDFTANGYDQFEAHCDFETITPAGANEWNVTGRCATAINTKGVFTLKVEGEKLTMSSDHGSFVMVRCPKT